MRKSILLCLIIAMIGVSGCMNNTISSTDSSNQYREEIQTYLEQKYGEKFQVDKMVRRVEMEEADVVIAQCHSEEYPNEIFDVVYHLSMDDIYKKEEIITLLKESGCYDETKLRKWENEVEPYFEDNYTNVIKQREFDLSLIIPDGVMVISRFKTPNYYPSARESQMQISDFIAERSSDLACYNYVFISDTSNVNEQEVINIVVNKSIKNQYINLVYTKSDFEMCKNVYYENYDFPYEHFEKDSNTTDIKNRVYSYGEQQ